MSKGSDTLYAAAQLFTIQRFTQSTENILNKDKQTKKKKYANLDLLNIHYKYTHIHVFTSQAVTKEIGKYSSFLNSTSPITYTLMGKGT